MPSNKSNNRSNLLNKARQNYGAPRKTAARPQQTPPQTPPTAPTTPVWLVEPHATMISRDGRPFGAEPGAQANSMAFPVPSVTAGAVRSLVGRDPKTGIFVDTQDDAQKKKINRLLEIEVQGPLLVELDESGQKVDWLVPAPADVLLTETGQNTGRREPLFPITVEGATVDMPDSLWAVGRVMYKAEKPSGNAPSFWYWNQMEAWLKQPTPGEVDLQELGHNGLKLSERTHVALQAGTRTAQTGMLFGTRELEFTAAGDYLSNPKRFALALATTATLPEGYAPVGGERRLAAWRKSNFALPACPSEVANAIVRDKACRLVLLTPADFKRGYLPDWSGGQEVTVKAAAIVQRPLTISGWDLQAKKPKPSRRLVPAGSVYFLQFTENMDQAAIRAWIQDTWMHTVSDDPQACRDGFGLAVLGTWDGKLKTMQV